MPRSQEMRRQRFPKALDRGLTPVKRWTPEPPSSLRNPTPSYGHMHSLTSLLTSWDGTEFHTEKAPALGHQPLASTGKNRTLKSKAINRKHLHWKARGRRNRSPLAINLLLLINREGVNFWKFPLPIMQRCSIPKVVVLWLVKGGYLRTDMILWKYTPGCLFQNTCPPWKRILDKAWNGWNYANRHKLTGWVI